jgi:DNA-binding SARP family transcriptional activator
VQRKPGKLLAYIALNTGSAIARDTLLRQLWPQMSTRRSCDSFYAAWSRLTRTLKNKEGNYILSDSNMLRLNTSTVTTDVGTFKNLYRELIFSDHSLETKINILIEMDKLYSTGLLPGFLFDTYIMIHQQRYRLLMVEAMLTGAKLLLEQEQRLQAQWFALRACEIDPEHEEVFRILSETNGERHFNLTKSEFLLG